MNQSDNVSRSNQNADGTTSNSLTTDAHQRLRLAAHILANGAIRATLKQRANRQQKGGAGHRQLQQMRRELTLKHVVWGEAAYVTEKRRHAATMPLPAKTRQEDMAGL